MLKDGKTEAELIARQGKQVAMITAEKFEESVGCKPENDDLDRCNCIEAGHIGHFQCGWDDERDMPVFIPGISKIAQNGEKTK
jgi:hypothetical protein